MFALPNIESLSERILELYKVTERVRETMDIDKVAERKARAVQIRAARAERSDLDQLILIYETPSRGRCLREKERLKAKIRARYKDNPQALHAVTAELKSRGIEL